MRILFIGGTGIISTACTELAVARGHEVVLANRRAVGPGGVEALAVDVHDERAAEAALGGRTWDAVVDFIAFTPDDIERDLRLFHGRTGQFVFISSASAYQRPSLYYRVTESTPLANPFWEYSRNKIACEERLLRALREVGFPATIVRPSLTYGDSQITLAVNSWERSFTAVDRMRRGLPVIVPGDGSSLWTVTHNSDFAKGLVGLLGHAQAIGHAFHITSDEVMTWDQIYRAAAAAAGVPDPELVHIASDFIAACIPEEIGGLIGDKATSYVYDNSKIKEFVPGFIATTPYREGVARSIAWFDADPARQLIDEAASKRWDRLIAAYRRGLDAAKRELERE